MRSVDDPQTALLGEIFPSDYRAADALALIATSGSRVLSMIESRPRSSG